MTTNKSIVWPQATHFFQKVWYTVGLGLHRPTTAIRSIGLVHIAESIHGSQIPKTLSQARLGMAFNPRLLS